MHSVAFAGNRDGGQTSRVIEAAALMKCDAFTFPSRPSALKRRACAYSRLSLSDACATQER